MNSEAILNKYSWINNELFQSFLDSELAKTVIESIYVQPALQNGENYSSFLIGAKVNYFNTDDPKCIHTKPFIIKASLGAQLVRSQDTFAKECFMYTEIIPKIERELRNVNIPTKMAPICFHGSVKDSFLILEDLTEQNFFNVNRMQGFNYNELKVCLSTLAKWHAASVKLIDLESIDLYKLYMKPHVCLNGSKQYRILLEHAVEGCIGAFKSDLAFEDICNKLIGLKSNVFEKCCNAVERNDNQFNVLTHGDLWSNNIMFCRDSNVNDFPLLIDFQVSYFGSAILDVSYLLFTSASESIKSTEFDLLFNHYCNEIISMLHTMNLNDIPVPSKQQLLDEFAANGRYGAFFSLFSIPMRVLKNAESDEVKRFLSDTIESQLFRQQIYSEPTARKLLENLLNYFNEKSYLN